LAWTPSGWWIAGVTSGWMVEEFAVAGVPQTRMGGGFDDHVTAMRAVWGPDPVEYTERTARSPPPTSARSRHNRAGSPCWWATTPRRDCAAPPGSATAFTPNATTWLSFSLIWTSGATPPLRLVATHPECQSSSVPRPASTLTGRPGPPRIRAGCCLPGEVASWTEDIAALESLGVDHVFISSIQERLRTRSSRPWPISAYVLAGMTPEPR
jgi:hypothetical protein